jgi:hypothetical protein
MAMVVEVVDAAIGGDTHKDTYTLEMLSPVGVRIASLVIDNDTAGFETAVAWIAKHAPGSTAGRRPGGHPLLPDRVGASADARRVHRGRGGAAQTPAAARARQVRPDRRPSGRAGRCKSGPGQQRQRRAVPTQPWRPTGTSTRPCTHRHYPLARLPTHRRLHRSSSSRGKGDGEIRRHLKRYIARERFRAFNAAATA